MTEPERLLIEEMLVRVGGNQALLERLEGSRVRELADGDMGSLIFHPRGGEPRRLGTTAAKAKFIDEDGVAVSVVINLDQHGDLYELDVWKVDFSPLKKWPSPGDIMLEE